MHSTYNRQSEEELIFFLKEGNQEAFVSIYHMYWDRLYLAAYNLLENLEEAEECVQNVFISIWQRREKLELTHSLYTYLAVAIKYQCLTVMAQNKRRRENLESSFAEINYTESFTPDQALISKEILQKLSCSINMLPPQCQQVYRMQAEEGLSIRAIAEQLQISNNTVKMHLKNANKRLRNDLLTLLPLLISYFVEKH